jgi:hypothetical protein
LHGRGSRGCLDKGENSVACRTVSVFFGAAEPYAVDGDNGDALFGRNFSAHGRDIVADEAHNARGIDECGLWFVFVNKLRQAGVQFYFAAPYHVYFPEVGVEAHPVQGRARRQAAADVPGEGGAPHGSVHKMQRIDDRVDHHARAAENAGALRHASRRRLAVARHVELLAFLEPYEDLFAALFEQGGVVEVLRLKGIHSIQRPCCLRMQRGLGYPH